ncbi:MAG: hypothetical protein H0W28_11980 [Pyrinomonadaceae bacterium]|nr:hypothetical protein [Pyrinomonadaceae bacterium]
MRGLCDLALPRLKALLIYGWNLSNANFRMQFDMNAVLIGARVDFALNQRGIETLREASGIVIADRVPEIATASKSRKA